MPPATKHPALLVTNIQCTRQIFRPNKALQRMGGEDGLDCFSNSELDSESDEGEEYRYEHKYETFI